MVALLRFKFWAVNIYLHLKTYLFLHNHIRSEKLLKMGWCSPVPRSVIGLTVEVSVLFSHVTFVYVCVPTSGEGSNH